MNDQGHPPSDRGDRYISRPVAARTLGADVDRLVRGFEGWWPGARPRIGDILSSAVVALFGLGFLAMVSTYSGSMAKILFACLVYPLFFLPFLWRRTYPEVAAWVVVAAHVCQLFLLEEPSPVNIAAPMAMYAIARWAESVRVRRLFLIVAVVGSALAAWRWGASVGAYQGTAAEAVASFLVITFLCFGATASAWLLGALVRQRQQAREEMVQKAVAVEHGRVQSIRLAAQEERSRIAREMHDVVAHSLSVVVVQSDGATYAIDRAEESGDTEALLAAVRSARATLATIGQTARESLADTRRLVAVLRQDDDAAEYAPTGGIDNLDELLHPLRAAGLEIHTDVCGYPRPLARTADLAAYRVVQESLTNVIKHAGEARVWVSLDYLDAALLITVRDDGAGITAVSDGAGHGLVGMRERVTALGGNLWAGAAPGGGFLVEARIPYDARTPSDTPPGARPEDQENR